MQKNYKSAKKIISLFLSMLMIISCCSAAVPGLAVFALAWDGATSTQPSAIDGVYQIGTAEELAWFAAQVNAGNTAYNALLTADIDLSGQVWTPIGNDSKRYAGTFDGNNFTVSNVYITTTSVDRGLFGKTANATIRNLNLDTVRIMTARNYTGTVVGVINGGAVENCHVTGVYLATSNGYLGGLIGQVEGTSPVVRNCTVSGTNDYATISGKEFAGGLIGRVTVTTTIENCHTYDLTVSGTGSVGGLIGRTTTTCTISDCSANRNNLIATAAYSGGFAGLLTGGTVDNCNVNEVTLSGTSYVGGFVGYAYDKAISYSDCHVTKADLTASSTYEGGFVGGLNVANTFYNCSVTDADLKGSSTYRGGFAGYANAKMTAENCFVKDISIIGTQYNGGFSGLITGGSSVTKCGVENLTMQTDNTYNGGFVGNLTGSANTLQYNYVVNASIDGSNKSYLGGFIGYSQSNAHKVRENYLQLTSFGGTATYTGAFVGRIATGFFADNFVTTVDALPMVGSATAGVAGAETGITAITQTDVADGALCATLNGITNVWEQSADGYPTVGENATAPELSDGYYLIYNGYQLEWFMKQVNGGNLTINAKLMADIDLHNKDWTPIGSDAKQYNGIFDGNGFTVSNIYITVTGVERGFFGKTNANAVIKNLNLQNVSVTGNNDYSGSLIGVVNGSDIENCHVVGVYLNTGKAHAGAFIGRISGTAPTVKNCSVKGTETMHSVSGTQYLGAFVGYMNTAVKISDCYAENVEVTASNSSSYIGGFFGSSTESSSIYENCHVKDVVLNGVNYIGGFSYAFCKTSTINKSSVVNVTINSTSTSAEARLGGFFGNVGWEGINMITYCYAVGVTINAPSAGQVGGFAGYTNNKVHVFTECYAQVDLINSTNKNVGMFVGQRATGTFNDCFVTDSDTYPLVGSGTAFVAGTQTGISAVTNEEIFTGALTDKLNDVTEIWQQHNDDFTAGWPELGNAEAPALNADGFYEIYNSFQLRWFRDQVNAANVNINAILMADIDLKNRTWDPIGNSDADKYTGTFDGNGHTIYNVMITTTSYDRGFFGQVTNATIKNLTLDGVSISGNRNYAGGIVGIANGVTLTDCTVCNVTVNTAGYERIGGLIGFARTNQYTVSNCTVENATLTGSGSIGGLIGRSEVKGTVRDCLAKNITITSTAAYIGGALGYAYNVTSENNTVQGIYINSTNSNAGGFVGETQNTAPTFINCSVIALDENTPNTIRGASYVGGFAGRTYSGTGTFTNCSVEDMQITATGDRIGGFVGENYSAFNATDCSVKNVVISGKTLIGGFIGQSNSASAFENCDVDTVTITGTQYNAGFIGSMNVASTYKKCDVSNINITGTSTPSYTAGFGGYITEKVVAIDACNVVNAKLTGTANIGGFLGVLNKGSTVQKSSVVNAEIKSTSVYTNGDYAIGGFIGIVGWGTANTVQYCFAQNVSIDADSLNVGGFIGKMDNAVHQIKEVYANAVAINSTKTYVGSFLGRWDSGTTTDCYAVAVDGLPLVGSATAGQSHVNANVIAVSADDVKDGTLTENLADITAVWKQHNDDTENGWPEIGEAALPELKDGYYEIYNSFQLRWFRDAVNAGELTANAKLMADIDLKNRDWYPIGNDSKRYAGHFDGNGHTVSNVSISTTAVDRGFFGKTNNATVTDLTLDGVAITTVSDYAGGLIAVALGGTFENCSVRNVSINNTGKSYNGGFIGLFGTNTATFVNCHTENVTINGAQYNAGFIGRAEKQATYTDCSATNVTINASGAFSAGFIGWAAVERIENCTVTGVYITSSNTNNGGFIGETQDIAAVIANCSVQPYDGKDNFVGGTKYVGGFIGRIYDGASLTVDGCSVVSTDVPATNAYVGGFVGENNTTGYFTDCSVYDAQINGTQYVGGFNGYAGKAGTYENCIVQTASVTGTASPTYAGGFFGYINAKSIITDCHVNMIAVTGPYYLGGFSSNLAAGSEILFSSVVDAQIKSTQTTTTTNVCVGGFIGTVGWGTPNKIQYSFAQNVSIEATGKNVGGFIGLADSSVHNISECYVNAITVPGENAYTGAFLGNRTTGNYSDLFAVNVENLPFVGSATVAVSGNETGITGVASSDVYDGTLESKLNAVTPVWKNLNEDYEHGYPVIDDGVVIAPTQNAEGYYEIYTSYQLEWFVKFVNAGNVNANAILMDDIDLCNKAWFSMGNNSNRYAGTFNGNQKTVKNINISATTDNQGFFGSTAATFTVFDLTLENVSVQSTASYVGALAGVLRGNAKNITVKNVNVKAASYAGGMVGYVDTAITVENCNVDTVSVSGAQFTGGMFGRINALCTVADCRVDNVTLRATNTYAGGFAGLVAGTDFTNCHVNGFDIESTTSNVGAMFGRVEGTTPSLVNCSATGTENMNRIKATQYIGGISGYMNSAVALNGITVKNINITATAGDSYIGGIYGASSEAASTYESCLIEDISLTGNNYMGGFSGTLCKATSVVKSGVVNVSVNSSSTSDNAYVGGFIGVVGWGGINTIQYCYAYGVDIDAVNAGNVGGFIGNTNNVQHLISECYASVNSINSTKKYVGSFIGQRATGVFADCFATAFENYPLIGSATAFVSGDVSAITEVTFDQVHNGELADELNSVTEVWKQHNNELTAGWPEIGTADPPVLNENGYYEIYNSFQLRWFRDTVNDGNININAILMADINLKNRTWEPIGNDGKRYAGHFDGNGHTVSNVLISSVAVDRGFFGQITNATIENLSLDGLTVNGNRSYSGGLVGVANGVTLKNCEVRNVLIDTAGYESASALVGYIRTNASEITNCRVVNAQIRGSKYVGGLVARIDIATTISDCLAENIMISATNTYVGGMVGYANGCNISDSIVKGIYITSTSNNAGGFIGESQGGITVTNCSVEPLAEDVPNSISAVNYVGGFIGRHYAGDAKFENCTVSDVTVTDSGSYVGGFIGENYKSATFVSCATQNITMDSDKYAGGFIGYLSAVATMAKCTTTDTVINATGTDPYVGGFAGYTNAKMTANECEVHDIQITAIGTIGGFSGNLAAGSQIEKSFVVNAELYPAAASTAAANTGGFIGVCGWSTANSITWSYVAKTIIDGEGQNIGGFIGKTDNAAHIIKECYADAEIASTAAYVGSFAGYKSSGTFTDCFASTDGRIPAVGSDVADLVETVSVAEVRDGTLANILDSISGIWRQYNNDYTNGYPVIGQANPPVQNADGYYEIYTAYQLRWFMSHVNASTENAAANAILMENINLNFREWTPIGKHANQYAGTFDGNGKTISGVLIATTASDRGFFGKIAATAVVKNLTLDGIRVTTALDYTGSVVGVVNGGQVLNCHVKNMTVESANSSKSYVGGLVGQVEGTAPVIQNCTVNEILLNGSSYVGGLIGLLKTTATVENCFVTNITVQSTAKYAGGMFGAVTANNTIRNSAVINVNATAAQYLGGFVGYTSATQNFENCHVTGVNLTATSTSVGGFSGESAGAAVFDSCSVKQQGTDRNVVSGTNYIGGFVGRVYSGNNTFADCSTVCCDVIANGYNAGGFMGENNSTVLLTDCHATDVVVEGTYNVGGFVGDSSAAATYTRCSVDTAAVYASKTTESNAGGFAGFTSAKAVINDCYVTDADVSGYIRVAGFIGALGGGSSIQKSYVLRTAVRSDAQSNTTDVKIGGFAGTIGWDSANTILYCYANDVTVSAIGEEVGGFAGNMNNAAHIVSECYVNATAVESDAAYVGTFVGIKSSGTITDCYASAVAALPRIGSATAGVEADNADAVNITNASEVADGTLVDRMNEITNIWQQYNEDYENGWPVIDPTATEPLLSEDGYYEIYTAYQLEWFTKYVNAGTTTAKARLMADIDLQSKPWKSIGTDSKKYAGVFDGNNHTVTNLYINATANDAGFFGATAAGFTVSDLTLTNVNVTSTKSYVGGLVGVLRGNVENCKVEGLTLSGASYVGGLAGKTEGNVTIAGSSVVGTLNQNTIASNGEYAGGLIGQSSANPCAIRNCTAENLKISGTQRVGGAVGDMSDVSIMIVNTFAKNISITANRYVGGLSYSLRAGSNMINCGSENISVVCSATGAIETGGLVGLLNGGASIAGSYAKRIQLQTNGNNVGGLVGNADKGTVSECWAYALNAAGDTNVGSMIGRSGTLTLMNSTFVGKKDQNSVGNNVAFDSLEAVVAKDIADNWFVLFEELANTYSAEDVLALAAEEFDVLYAKLLNHYNIVLYYADVAYASMVTENGFGIADVHEFMSLFLLRHNVEIFTEFMQDEENLLDAFFTDELLATDVTSLATSVLLYDYYEEGRDLWNSLVEEYTSEAMLAVLGETRFVAIENFLADCFNELTAARLEAELDAVILPYEEQGSRINMLNFREIGNACSAVETVIYDELLDELSDKLKEKYAYYLIIKEQQQNFVKNDAFSVFESSTVEYPTRVVREDDVARDESPSEDYVVTQEKMDAIVEKIDTVLMGDDFAYVLGLDEPLDGTLRTLINEELYNDEIINSLVESTYVKACEELEKAIEEEASIKVLGITITFRGKARDVIESMIKSFGLYLQPKALAGVIDGEKYPRAKAVLLAAGADWSKVELEDPTSENYLYWGVTDKDSFIDAMGNSFRGLYPAARPLFTTHSFSKQATEDVISGCDLKVKLTVNSVDAYDETIIPLFETLGITDLTDSATFNTYTSTDEYFDSILYPLCNWVEDTLANAPLATVAEMLPNLAYYMEFGFLEQWLKALATSIHYDIDVTVGTSWAHKTVDVTKGSIDLSVYDMLSEDEDDILYGADLYSISGLLDVILNATEIDMRLPVSENSYLASLGEMVQMPSANSAGIRYYVKANRGDVMYVVLRYLARALGNRDFVEHALNAFNDEDEPFEPLDDTLAEIVDNIGASAEDTVAAIAELCFPQEYNMNPVSVATAAPVKPAKVVYTKAWAKEDAQYIVDNLSDFIDNMFYLLGMQELDVMLSDLVGGEIYRNENLSKIIIEIRDLVTDIDGYEEILYLLNMDISDWNDVTEDSQWGFEDGDKDGFLDALCVALAPVNNLLAFILADQDIVILDGQITAFGYEGYAHGIVPILEALGCDDKDIVSAQRYLADTQADQSFILKHIIVPIFNLLDRVYADPAVELFNILPNILYFAQSGMLSTAVENVLHGVFVLLDTIRPIYNLQFESEIDINGLLIGLLADVFEDTGFELPEDESILNFLVGGVNEKTSATGETIYIVEGASADLLTILLRYALKIIFYKNNEDIIVELICEDNEFDVSERETLTGVFTALEKLCEQGTYGSDNILAVLYWIYVGGYAASEGVSDFLKDFNGSWRFMLDLLRFSDDEQVKNFGMQLADFLNLKFDSVLDEDGLASNGLISFFERIIEWFKMIFEKIKAFFEGLAN
ncbi:MAG: hypothetical protein E7523_03295 [Ruminococcaceae bacterium]|nr:hypothetical protein [Oscillospiraceae bacterium]